MHHTGERLVIIISMPLWPLHKLPNGGKNKKIKNWSVRVWLGRLMISHTLGYLSAQ